ncbi:MAG TPA: UPF0262 family protein [Rhizomicrobium sp.]|nr:UPF0262 family protein [Rhizomicrobium sp.]
MTAEPQMKTPQADFRIAAIAFDEDSVVTRPRPIEQEREVAIVDILEKNFFRLKDSPGGPYYIILGVTENRLVLDVSLKGGVPHGKIMLSLTPLAKVIKDYFLVCDTYYKAIRTAPPHQIEALDMGRRALHDEASTLLKKRLEDKVELDFDTARRLFTLICVMHMRG